MARTRTSLPVTVVHAAYRLDLDESEWLAELVERATAALGDGLGVIANTFDARDPAGVKPIAIAYGSDLPDGAALAFHRFHAESPHTRLIYGRHKGAPAPCQTISGSLGARFAKDRTVPKYLHPIGAGDVMVVMGIDPSGYGVAVSAPMKRATRPDRRRVEQWSRVAAHLASAHRLRHRLTAMSAPLHESDRRAPLDHADAIFSPRGRLEHARDGMPPAGQAETREAVRRILHAWTLERRAPEDALAHWRALEHGRWSVVDTFDTDGKRYLVARRNDPAVDGIAHLTERERQVVAFAVLGHPLKLIAYELGLSTATVSYHLSRASEKVRARSRAQLAAAWNRARSLRPGVDARTADPKAP
jgi:DNA-binding CsgD family transcriptional regulator